MWTCKHYRIGRSIPAITILIKVALGRSSISAIRKTRLSGPFKAAPSADIKPEWIATFEMITTKQNIHDLEKIYTFFGQDLKLIEQEKRNNKRKIMV